MLHPWTYSIRRCKQGSKSPVGQMCAHTQRDFFSPLYLYSEPGKGRRRNSGERERERERDGENCAWKIGHNYTTLASGEREREEEQKKTKLNLAFFYGEGGRFFSLLLCLPYRGKFGRKREQEAPTTLTRSTVFLSLMCQSVENI